MATMTIRLPDDKHERLKRLAASRGVSLNKLIEEFSTQAIAEADAYTRFQIYSSEGSAKRGLETLDQLDGFFEQQE